MSTTQQGLIDRFVDTLVIVHREGKHLVHEYMEDSDTFAEDLQTAESYTSMLLATHDRIRDFAIRRMQLPESSLPAALRSAGPQSD